MKSYFLKTLALFALIGISTLFSFNTPNPADGITPSTALESYLKNGDQTFKWEVKDTYTYGDITAYEVLLTSQKCVGRFSTHELLYFQARTFYFCRIALN